MKYRMYFFVPYNLSPIQKAIQAGHAALEYAVKYKDVPDFKCFMEQDKTWIILNGGTTRNYMDYRGMKGDMNELLMVIDALEINHTVFYEPDLNGALTAICFLCDERVWDKEMYPDLAEGSGYDKICDFEKSIGGWKNLSLRDILQSAQLA